jgi:LuxR family glucitol operon transcriptional activator
MLADLLVNALGQILGEVTGESFETLLDRRALERGLAAAVSRAEQRFAREYQAQDAELAGALAAQARFADSPSVRAALRELLTRPFHDPAQPIARLQRSFADVLPERIERTRVDAAVTAFLSYLGQEVLYVPQLRDLYSMAFQKSAAESNRTIAASADAMAQSIAALRSDLAAARPALPAPDSASQLALPAGRPPERQRPWHNLPQRSYTRFVGRQAELEKLTQLLLPHPRSRHFVVTLDGIGGVGKSALALELAYRYRDGYAALPPDDRFEAIVWASAKRTLLTAGGIQQRQQTFNTLADLYREIATVLEQPAILQSEPDRRRGLVERALTAQRTLLIVDNLETVDDEELLSFLREIPDPTKVIVTTRHRIDIAYAIRLAGMPEPDAKALMMVEAARKNVALTIAADTAATDDLSPLAASPAVAVLDDMYRKTGGLPLAIVWSIGLISLGHSVESVLRRLGSGHSDIARFCFAESVARIRDRDAYRLLLALSLFESHVSRAMLGEVAGLGADVIGRDDGLAELLQLSLAEQKGERFFLLPLTHSYALEELAARPELERELRERWIEHLTELARPYKNLRWRWHDLRYLQEEGVHLVTLASWSEQQTRLNIVLQILPALSSYYDLTGQWADRLRIGRIGLEYADLIDDQQSKLFIRTRVLSWVLSQQGDHKQADRYLADAFNIAQQIDDIQWQCEALLLTSQGLRRRKALDQASELCGRALQLVAEPQYTYERANIEYELGKIARDRGNWRIAQSHFLAARDIFVRNADSSTPNEHTWGILAQLGFVEHQLGDVDAAAQMYLQAVDSCRLTGGKGALTTLLVRLATLEQERGNLAHAQRYAREALEWSRKLGMVQEHAQAQAIVERLEPPTPA